MSKKTTGLGVVATAWPALSAMAEAESDPGADGYGNQISQGCGRDRWDDASPMQVCVSASERLRTKCDGVSSRAGSTGSRMGKPRWGIGEILTTVRNRESLF